MIREDTFKIKVGDTSPALIRTLRTAEGPLVLNDGDAVRFSMRKIGADEAAIYRADAAKIAGQPGVVAYYWLDGDTAEAGLYEAEFKVIWADGSQETVPNYGFLKIEISPGI